MRCLWGEVGCGLTQAGKAQGLSGSATIMSFTQGKGGRGWVGNGLHGRRRPQMVSFCVSLFYEVSGSCFLFLFHAGLTFLSPPPIPIKKLSCIRQLLAAGP